MDNGSVGYIPIQRISKGILSEEKDWVAVEEPLEIQLEYSSATGRMIKNIAVTMRTPGQDGPLALGFLFTEAILPSPEMIESIQQKRSDPNQVRVILKENQIPVLPRIARNFYAASSCGICGKASIDQIKMTIPNPMARKNFSISAFLLTSLPDKLRSQQKVFQNTGGLHACGLFNNEGQLVQLQEDIGRHNAVDKVIGSALSAGLLPLHDYVLILSGRAGFELVQKAAMAGIPIVASIGAPSSLAVEMARDNGMTLVGFLRNQGMNIYCGQQRILMDFDTAPY